MKNPQDKRIPAPFSCQNPRYGVVFHPLLEILSKSLAYFI